VRVRAVIFDVYGTLLRVGPPPADAPARWHWLWESTFGGSPRLGLDAFIQNCSAIVQKNHAAARARGISYPEVYWPRILDKVLPEFCNLPETTRRNFEVSQARLLHTTSLMPDSASVIRLMLATGVFMGVASNSQPSTIHELDDALHGAGLGTDVFAGDLTFWSFEHGFSKPDPHVFEILSARLSARGIDGSEVLMIGDRTDNDIGPARTFGWHAFHLNPPGTSPHGTGGGWLDVMRWFEGRLGT
jgi:putative hydrolase of the HAD superfamily